MWNYAQQLTAEAQSINQVYVEDGLKQFGCGDRAILAATLIVSYFNLVNWIVLGLKVELDSVGGRGTSTARA